MKAIKINQIHSLEAYFEYEKNTTIRHEFHDGKIVAMAGGRPQHNQISINTSVALSITLGDKPCVVYGMDLKVVVESVNRTLYPDLMVVCEPLEMYNNHVDAIVNPSLIIEVLSPSTERYDRTTKFKIYSKLPSFKEYILIATDSPVVETFYREATDYWHIASAVGLESSIYLKSIDCTIALKDIYKKVKDLKDPQLFLGI